MSNQEIASKIAAALDRDRSRLDQDLDAIAASRPYVDVVDVDAEPV